MAKNIKEIVRKLENIKLSRKMLGGVDEDDVWEALEMIHNEYSELLETERERAQGVINEWQRCAIDLAKQLKDKDMQIKRYKSAAGSRTIRSAGEKHGEWHG